MMPEEKAYAVHTELEQLRDKRLHHRTMLLETILDADLFATSWSENIWRLVDDLLSVLRIPAMLCDISTRHFNFPKSEDSVTNLVLLSESGGEHDFQLSPLILKSNNASCFLPEHTCTFEELVAALRVTSSMNPTWPIDFREWEDYAMVCYEVVELARSGETIENFPHATFRRNIVRCGKQIQAIALFAQVTFPNGKSVSTEPLTRSAPPAELIETCRAAVRKHIKDYCGQRPTQTAIYNAVGGTKKVTMRAAKIAIAEEFPVR